MLQTIKGVYENGQIVFSEKPPFKNHSEVIITAIETENYNQKNTQITTRVLGGLDGRIIISSDFDEPMDELQEY
ncbi:MAG: hypothetical protein RI955_1828 [Bacteroidota bacterium]|jgi:hypothetical protein